jgi:hydroxymethylpyrimidine pyrophosphatase-like HAD family hydrolase
MTSDELLARAGAAIGDVVSLTCSSRGGLLEASAAGVSKASTLATLVADLGHGAEDVVAFGDMPNDIPMLAWSRHGVAVANAHPDVLAVADEVTSSNDDDGVAVVLERLLA